MTKAELIAAMKDFPDDMKVIGSSLAHNDIFEILQGGYVLCGRLCNRFTHNDDYMLFH